MRAIGCVLAVVFFVTSSLLADDSPPVGEYGAPDRLVIKTQVISPQAVRQELLRNWQVQIASAPSASLKDYVTLIGRHVQLGFLASGFAHPQVHVGPDANGHIGVSVVEGQRYRYGPIHVTGATDLSVDRLIALLTHPQNVETFDVTQTGWQIHLGMDPIDAQTVADWPTGQFVNFTPQRQQQLARAVHMALGALGFMEAKFGLQLQPDGQQAALNITIDHEGARATVASIEVTGLGQNTPREIIHFLNLASGQPCGLEDLQAIQRKLWNCGRFKKHVVDATFSGPEHSGVAVKIDLGELPGLPPIDQPLSALDEAALRCGRWLLDRCRAGDDVLMTLRTPDTDPSVSLRVAAGPDGISSSLRVLPAAHPTTAPGKGPAAAEYAMFFTPRKVGMYARRHRFTYATTRPSLGGMIAFSYLAPPDGTGKYDMSLNAALKASHGGMTLKARVAPIGFVEFVHRSGFHSQVKDGVLTAENRDETLRIETATGRLLDYERLQNGMRVRLSLGPGLVQAEANAVDRAAGGGNECDPGRPLESGAQFAADQLWAAVRQYPRLKQMQPGIERVAAAVRLFGPPAAAMFDRTVLDDPDDPDPTFFIPGESGPPPNAMVAMVLAELPRLDQILQRGSWPWTLARQIGLVYCGLTQSFPGEMQRMLSTQHVGPIGYLACAEWLRNINPRASVGLAKAGLQHMGDDEFAADVRALTSGNCVAGDVVRQWADHLRQLPPAESRQLCAALPPQTRVPVEDLIELLRTRGAEPIEKALPEALSEIWTVSLRDSVRKEFNALAPTPLDLP